MLVSFIVAIEHFIFFLFYHIEMICINILTLLYYKWF